jgi:hypothetical protein
MHLVHLVLTCPDLPQPSSTAERILDTLRARLDPRCGIEHIRIRAGLAGVDLGLFLSGDGTDGAPQAADAIANLLAALPGWTATVPQ